MNTEYRQTGNTIDVPLHEMEEHVRSQIEAYNNNQTTVSPFTTPLIYTLESGKQVQVPTDIQQRICNEADIEQIEDLSISPTTSDSNNNWLILIIAVTFIIFMIYFIRTNNN